MTTPMTRHIPLSVHLTFVAFFGKVAIRPFHVLSFLYSTLFFPYSAQAACLTTPHPYLLPFHFTITTFSIPHHTTPTLPPHFPRLSTNPTAIVTLVIIRPIWCLVPALAHHYLFPALWRTRHAIWQKIACRSAARLTNPFPQPDTAA